MTKPKLSPLEARHELWRRANLSWKCHQVQKEMYEIFYESPKNTTHVWLLARQTGKSFLLAILALEQALKQPHSIIKLLTDTKLHVKTIFEKIFIEVLEDCPSELKPEYTDSKFTFYFANGSQIQLAGSDGKHYERLRGQKAHLILVDEAGFCADLEEIVKSVLFPTTTHTGGKIILSSTPPADPDHDFYKFEEEAELNGTLFVKTIYDNPLLTMEQIERIKREMGGENAPKFQREYLCKRVREESVIVFPEFNEQLEKEVIKEWPKPPFYHPYVGMDVGYKDLTALIFGYYDFRSDKIIIEDEMVIKGKDFQIPKLSRDILDKEKQLWTNFYTNEHIVPYKRISDISYIVIQEMSRETNKQLIFQNAQKDDKHAAVNNFRVLLANRKVIINPKCVNFIRHLKNCKWNKRKDKPEFTRSPDDGHYDTVDAAIYMIRSMEFKKNPYPAFHGYDTKDLFVKNPEKFENPQIEIYKKLFNIKSRKIYG